MTTILLIVHVLIALALVGVILLQRSEGGALGIGGGGLGGSSRAGARIRSRGPPSWSAARPSLQSGSAGRPRKTSSGSGPLPTSSWPTR